MQPEDQIYTDPESGRHYAFNPTTGQTRWLDQPTPRPAGPQVFTDPASGRRYAVDPATGQTRWHDQSTPGPVPASPQHPTAAWYPGQPADPVQPTAVLPQAQPGGFTPVQPPRGSRRRGVLIAVGVVVGLFVVLVIVGAIVGTPKPQPAAAIVPATTSTAPSPATTSSAAARRPASSSSAPSATVRLSNPITTLAPKKDRDTAAAILAANVKHYRQLVDQGMALASQKDNSLFVQWRTGPAHPEADLSYMDAFTLADSHFTADNEPQAISNWRDDMGSVGGAIGTWINTAVDWRGGFTSDQAYRDSVAALNKAFNVADQDVADVQSGK